MSDTNKIWVLSIDYGSDGLAEPFMAFRTKETAERAKDLIERNPSATRMRVSEVPIWSH